MDDERTDAPQLDLTPPAGGPDGADALQLGPADLPALPAAEDDAFAMRTARPMPSTKPSRPVTAEANASVVAALMGRPVAKSKPTTPTPPEPTAEPTAPQAAAPTYPVFELSYLPISDALINTHAVLDRVAVPDAGSEVFRPPGPPNPPSPGPGPSAYLRPGVPPLSIARIPTPVPASPHEVERPPRAPEPPARQAVPVAPVWSQPRPATPTPPAPKRPRPTPRPAPPPPAGPTGAWWTIPLTFVGIAIVACAVLIPAADDTRRDAYELAKIEQDVDYFERQSAVNADFLKRVDTDPTLAERLAMRQLHQTRAGVKLAPLAGPADRFGASPYAMTRLDPPPPLPSYRPVDGPLADAFRGGKRPQQMAAIGLLVAGAGVLLGGTRRRTAVPQS